MSTLLLVALLLLAALLPWGPGNHLSFAYRVYRNRRKLVSSATARLLREQRHAFYYGNIAADIISFKSYGGPYNHCHRWEILDEMRERASNAAEEAFVLGYTAHLAADTIAHNHFVPYHLARYARSKSLGHLYWEMRADRFVGETRWKTVSALKNDPRLAPLDELINATVPKKALSMRTNKLLFNHILLISERDRWRRGVDRLHGLAWAPLERSFLDRFRRASVGRIRLALSRDGLRRLAEVDVNGREAQRSAWHKRRRLMRMIAKSARRRAASEEAAALYLEGMESPPPPQRRRSRRAQKLK
jgi:hypothetical protein